MTDFGRIMRMNVPSERTLRENISAYSIPAAAKVYEEFMEAVDHVTRDLNVNALYQTTVTSENIEGCGWNRH